MLILICGNWHPYHNTNIQYSEAVVKYFDINYFYLLEIMGSQGILGRLGKELTDNNYPYYPDYLYSPYSPDYLYSLYCLPRVTE